VLFVAALTAAAGRFSLTLPFTPVPVTLQVVVVLTSAVVLGPRLALLAQLSFLGAGLSGLPVFAESAVLPPGPLRFLGPTSGYLLGCPVAVLVTGVLASTADRLTALRAFAAMAAGLAVVYAAGTLWLAGLAIVVSSAGVLEALQRAAAVGVYPFIALDLVKLVVASRVVRAARRHVAGRI
jgi:biotin transport system substrate-specific component